MSANHQQHKIARRLFSICQHFLCNCDSSSCAAFSSSFCSSSSSSAAFTFVSAGETGRERPSHCAIETIPQVISESVATVPKSSTVGVARNLLSVEAVKQFHGDITPVDEAKGYCFVLLDCPYDTWDLKLTQDLFAKCVALKLDGYVTSKAYPYGTLPLDTIDFIATHQLLCEKEDNVLTPVMAYKSISLSRCILHKIEFPALSILKGAGAVATQHIAEVNRILDSAKTRGTGIAYDGSWAISPKYRKNKQKTDELKHIMRAISLQYHTYKNIPEIIGFGVPRLKTEKYFETIGYQQIRTNDSNQCLPPVPMRSLQNEPVVLVYLNQFADEAIAAAKEYHYLWTNRMEISRPKLPV